ncbi:MAG TPA: aminotransferase class V-fold PLP-dependent enzyme [Pyrinomonadaceae bacterium]|nr:aminotransferase class V-fold PLP-dependent enzyme [Pyrinomonadaceae bacterium]
MSLDASAGPTTLAPLDAMNEQIRALFPITQTYNYLNHAAVSPPPAPTIAAVESQLRDVSISGSLNYRQWIATKERTRQLIAGMMGARPEQVAFLRNTSDALSSVANGLSWKPGDNLVTFALEFPSNVYPWLRLRDTMGVEIRVCEEQNGRIDLDKLISLIDARTRVVAISHVQYASGFRADLERLGRATRHHDALLVVDIIQSLGVLPINVESDLIDVAAAAGHKWLLTPEGIGLLYLSDRARERIEPTLVGWVSVPNPDDYNNFSQGWNKGTLPWETGTGPSALFYGMEASLKLLTETGVRRIAEYLEELTDHLCGRLANSDYEVVSSRAPQEKSQIVCIQHKGEFSPMSLYAHLKERNIITAPRGERLRISPHLYNTREEIDALVDSLP